MEAAGLGMMLGIEQGALPGLVTLGLTLLLSGPGFLLVRSFRKSEDCNPVDIPISIGFGLAVFGYVADLVYMIGLLDIRIFFNAYLVISCLCLGLASPFVVRSFRSLAGPLGAGFPKSRWEQILFVLGWLVVFHLLLGFYIANVAPPSDGDSVMVYERLFKRIGSGVGFHDLMLLQQHKAMVLNRMIGHIFGCGYYYGGLGSLHLFNFVFLCVIACTIHFYLVYVVRLIHRWNPFAILSAFSIFEICLTGMSVKVDYGVAMFVVICAVAVFSLRWRNLLVAILLGLVMASRVSAVPVAFVLWVVFCFSLVLDGLDVGGETSRKAGIASSLMSAVPVGFASLAVASPTYIMQYVVFANPVYPLFNGMFGYVQHHAATLENVGRYRVEGVFAPFQVFFELIKAKLVQPPGYLHRLGQGLSPVFLLVPLAFSRNRQAFLCWLFFVLGYMAWFFSGHFHRQLLGVAFVGSILLPDIIFRRLNNAVLRAGLMLLVLATATFVMIHPYYNLSRVGYFLGLVDDDTYYENQIRLNFYKESLTPQASTMRGVLDLVGDESLLAVGLDPVHPKIRNHFAIRDSSIGDMADGSCGTGWKEDVAALEKESSQMAFLYSEAMERLISAGRDGVLTDSDKLILARGIDAAPAHFWKRFVRCPEQLHLFAESMGFRWLLVRKKFAPLYEGRSGFLERKSFRDAVLFSLEPAAAKDGGG